MISYYTFQHILRLYCFVLFMLCLLMYYNTKDEDDAEDFLPTGHAYQWTSRVKKRLIAHELQDENLNVPVLFYFSYFSKLQNRLDDCETAPSIFDINFSNTYWQLVNIQSPQIFIFSSFLDTRPLSRINVNQYSGPAIRILAMVKGDLEMISEIPLICKVWTGQTVSSAQVQSADLLWYKEWGWNSPDRLQAYLLSCPAADLGRRKTKDPGLPKFVLPAGQRALAIVQDTCERPSNLLLLNEPEKERSEGLAVCLKGLSFPDKDISRDLAEWIEIQFALGVSRIVLYILDVHWRTRLVIKEYSRLYQQKLQVIPISLPGNLPNTPKLRQHFFKMKVNQKRQNEVLAYNDCLMRNINKAKYVALLDLDEVIVPTEGSLTDLILNLEQISYEKQEVYDSYCFQNFYFFTKQEGSVSTYFSNANRTRSGTSGEFMKCLHAVEQVRTVHNHLPIHCFSDEESDNCSVEIVDPSLGKLHHYRETCVGILNQKCEELQGNQIQDSLLLRFHPQVQQNLDSSKILEKYLI